MAGETGGRVFPLVFVPRLVVGMLAGSLLWSGKFVLEPFQEKQGLQGRCLSQTLIEQKGLSRNSLTRKGSNSEVPY